jgi:amino acid transporter
MHVLAQVGGVPVLGLLIDIGALVSLFAGTLACITAAARVLMLMAPLFVMRMPGIKLPAGLLLSPA